MSTSPCDAMVKKVSNEILENLEIKGLYTLSDSGIELDENSMSYSMWFWYDALTGCNLQIDRFYVQINPGLKYLDTESYIDVENINVEKVNSKALGNLLKLVRSGEVPEESDLLFEYKIEIREELEKLVRSIEVPEEFYDLEEYKIEIQEDEELWTLKIDCVADSLNYLPSVKRISEFVEHVFKKAGIEYAHE